MKLPPEVDPSWILLSSPKTTVLQIPMICRTGQNLLDRPYRAPRAPISPPPAYSNNKNRDGSLQPHMTKTG